MSLRQRTQRPSESTNEGGHNGGTGTPRPRPPPPAPRPAHPPVAPSSGAPGGGRSAPYLGYGSGNGTAGGYQTPQPGMQRSKSSSAGYSGGGGGGYYSSAGYPSNNPATPGAPAVGYAGYCSPPAQAPYPTTAPPAYGYAGRGHDRSVISLPHPSPSAKPRVLQFDDGRAVGSLKGAGGYRSPYAGNGSTHRGTNSNATGVANPYHSSKSSSSGFTFKNVLISLFAITFLTLTGTTIYFRSVLKRNERELREAEELVRSHMQEEDAGRPYGGRNANSETGGGDLPDVSDVSDGENASATGPIYDTSSDEEEERDELAALEEGTAVPHQRKANAETPDADDADNEEEDDEEEFSDPANTLEIQIVSDLHIEFYDRGRSPPDFLIEPRAPILALLGDIGLACTDQLRAFLHSQSERFERVLFLAGNHEYYNRGKAKYSMDEQDAWMRAVCSERDNLHFMEKDSMVLNGVLVLATTLWSEIPDERLWEAEASMNDYALSYNHAEGEPPRRVTATETRQFHRESVAWLRAQHADARRDGRKVLVLTHHTPVLSGTSHPQYDGSDLTCCFSSDLRGLLLCGGPPIVAWACGHTHYNFDFMVGNVRVLSNQRGYKGNPKRSYDRGGIVLKIHAKG